MSLKSIRDSYTGLLQAFTEAGVKLNESQKASLDTFIVALESKMSKQKEDTVKATKKIVTEHLEKEYKAAFESILKHQAEHAALASKVQTKVQHIKESKKLGSKVSKYLDLYVESVLPKKTIIDFDRMRKLEQLHESLKSLLVVSEDDVTAKKAELDESLVKAQKDYETKLAKMTVKLNESQSKVKELSTKLDTYKVQDLLESKTKDLPLSDARKLKKHFAESTIEDIEKNFTAVFESMQAEQSKAEEAEKLELEDEISDILRNDTKEVKEDDILKNRPHNAHVDEKDDNKTADETPEEEYETLESFKYDKNGDLVLDESEIIDSELMKLWCDTASALYTK